MKNKLLTLTLILATICPSFALTTYPTITNSARGYNYRPTYNPYGGYYRPYAYNRNNFYRNPNLNTIKRWNQIRQRNRIRNNIRSLLYRNNYGNNYGGMRVYNGEYYPNNKKGILTGFSTPINSSALNLIPNNANTNTNYYSPTNNMKLFQSPLSGQEFYFNDGRFFKDLHGLDSATGVKVIYD